MNELDVSRDGRGVRVLVAVSRFNDFVTARLLDGALAELRALGVADADVTVAHTPGAFELPLIAKSAAKSGRFDAIVCLGAVIRGDTDHYQYVCDAATDGILRAGLDTGVPAIFGVLTVDSLEQAVSRAGGKAGNKGADAARAAIETVRTLEQLKTNP